MNDFETTKSGYVVVTDTIPNDGSADVSDAIQQLIDDNPIGRSTSPTERTSSASRSSRPRIRKRALR